jgi:hypothetical protein
MMDSFPMTVSSRVRRSMAAINGSARLENDAVKRDIERFRDASRESGVGFRFSCLM